MLVQLHDKLLREVQYLSEHSLKSTKQAGEELADIGSDNFQRDMELNLMGVEGKKLQLIQQAIDRIKTNSYGVCSDCSEIIQEGRLEAIPYARLCISCKSQREYEERNAHLTLINNGVYE
jgi:DnaK suppressor protein